MVLKLCLVLSLIISPAFSQCDINRTLIKFKKSTYDFNLGLVTRIADLTDNHFVTSPLSAWTLISAISEGASGITLEEIQKVLRSDIHMCFQRKNYAIIKEIVTKNGDTILERSGAIFVDKNLNVKQSFIQKIDKLGISKVRNVTFDKFDEAASAINGFVNEATHGVIDEIVSPDDLEGKFILLTDVIYFKGIWKNQFNSDFTRERQFKNEHGNEIGKVKMMFKKGEFNVADIQIIKASVLELPYKGDDFSMLIFLPNAGTPLSQVIYNLKEISVCSIYSVLNETGSNNMVVHLPRFKVSSNIENLKELMIDMGIKSMFDPSTASFPQLCDYSVFVSDMMQKADIEVTEEGTVAVAVSSAMFESRSMPPSFVVDRPFMFMIVHKRTEYVLFTGAYSKPSSF